MVKEKVVTFVEVKRKWAQGMQIHANRNKKWCQGSEGIGRSKINQYTPPWVSLWI